MGCQHNLQSGTTIAVVVSLLHPCGQRYARQAFRSSRLAGLSPKSRVLAMEVVAPWYRQDRLVSVLAVAEAVVESSHRRSRLRSFPLTESSEIRAVPAAARLPLPPAPALAFGLLHCLPLQPPSRSSCFSWLLLLLSPASASAQPLLAEVAGPLVHSLESGLAGALRRSVHIRKTRISKCHRALVGCGSRYRWPPGDDDVPPRPALCPTYDAHVSSSYLSLVASEQLHQAAVGWRDDQRRSQNRFALPCCAYLPGLYPWVSENHRAN